MNYKKNANFIAESSSEGVCSVHQGLSCDDNANCIEKNETANGFICVCNEGYHGDGLKNGTGCHGNIKLSYNLWETP